MEQETTTTLKAPAPTDGGRPDRIVRRTLHDELLDRLRQMIIHGDLTPGGKVPEKALCDRFGV